MRTPDEAGLSIQVIKVCVDANDVPALARFWGDLLGYRTRESTSNATWLHLEPPSPNLPPLTIQPVPEGKAGKNRLHLDVFVTDPDGWIARAESLGATKLWSSEDPDDWFQVLADPEGNEFCFCRLPASLAGS